MRSLDYPPKTPSNDNGEDRGGVMGIKQEGFIEDPAGAGSVPSAAEHEPAAEEESIVASNPVLEGVAGRSRSAAKRRGKGVSPLVLTESAPEAAAPPETIEEESEELVLEDGTPKEKREALAAVIAPEEDRILEVQERLRNLSKIDGDAPKKPVVAEAERADVQAKETEYLNAYKDLERKSGFLNKILKGKELRDESERVAALKRAYDEARVAYGNALTSSAAERLGEKGSAALRSERVLERYNRLVRFNEVVKPAAEKRIQARLEALDSRGQSAFDKGLSWAGRKNAELEKIAGGKMQARAVRAAATTILVVGGAAILGGAGTTSLLALAGYGSYRFVRALGSSVLAGAAGELGGRAYESLRGRKVQKAAQESLKNAGRTSNWTSELTIADLERIDAKREKLAVDASEEALQKKKLLVKAITAFGIGAGAAGALAELSSMQHAAEAAAGSTDLTSEQARGIEGLMSGSAARHGLSVTSAEHATDAAPTVPDAIPTGPVAPTLENALGGATIDKPGQGMGELFVGLRHTLNADTAVIAHPSAALKHVLESDPNALAREINAASGGESMVMHQGDQLLVDKNQNVWFQAKGGEPKLLFENDAATPGGFKAHVVEGAVMYPDHVETAHTAVAPAEHAVADMAPALDGTEAPEYVPVAAELDGLKPGSADTAPVAEAVSPAEHPVASADIPEKPAEAPVHETPAASSAEVFTNHNDVSVDLREPHAYVTAGKNGSEVLSIVGGKGNDSFYAAQQFVAEHPEYFKEHPDAIVRFAATDIDSVTGAARPYTGGFRISADGTPSMVVDNELPPPPSAETFTKRLDFTFKRTS